MFTKLLRNDRVVTSSTQPLGSVEIANVIFMWVRVKRELKKINK